MPPKVKRVYRATVGLNYGPASAKRVEAGDLVDDLPAESIPWLLEQGLIELAPAPKKGGSDG